MAGDGRAGDVEYAERVNAAAELLAAGVGVAEAARVVGSRFGVSVRQGRRYVDRAASGPVVVPERRVVFTVTLPAALAARVREAARTGGDTMSGLVARALTEFLSGDRRKSSAR